MEDIKNKKLKDIIFNINEYLKYYDNYNTNLILVYKLEKYNYNKI